MIVNPTVWKVIIGFPDYLIDSEGNIVHKSGRFPLSRRWKYSRKYIRQRSSAENDKKGDATLFVVLRDIHGDKFQRLLYLLMEQNWPGIAYPRDWRPRYSYVNPRTGVKRVNVSRRSPLWKRVHGFPLYEISEEGQLRRVGNKMPKARFWVFHNNKMEPEHSKTLTGGSLCVTLNLGDDRNKLRRVWKLMEVNWPTCEYPDNWRSVYHRKTRSALWTK